MNDDWYDEGLKQLHCDIAEDSGLTVDQVASVYTYLCNAGFIDYDVEKEMIWETYYSDQDIDEPEGDEEDE